MTSAKRPLVTFPTIRIADRPRKIFNALRCLPAAALFCVCTQLTAQTYTFSNFAPTYGATGIAVEPSGNVYVTSYYNHTLLRISPTGTITTFAGLAPTPGGADGTGSAARFFNPRALAIDEAGNLYLADTANHTIRKITPAGGVTTLAGRVGIRGWEDGTGSAAQFDSPQGLAVDTAGNVYVADTGSRSIRKITPAGVVTTLAGLGYVTGAVDGTGLAARFDSPQGITVAANGDVYVADTNNHAIRKISPTGVTTTFAGSLTNRGSLDGSALDARFDSPQALAIDASGTLFVADTNNFTIRKITSAGVVTTIAGTTGTPGDLPGTGAAARFNQVRGLAVTTNGTIYIADSYNLKLGSLSSQLAITIQPQNQTVASGSTATFSITATGAAPITFQWQKNGNPIAGATNSTLTLPSAQSSDAATYTVTVGNSVGTLASTGAILAVLSPLANDNFANAQVLTGSSGSATGNNNGSTGEPGEPTHNTPAATASSVWYKWTPTESGTAVFNFSSSNITIAAAVYTGAALNSLTHLYGGPLSRPSIRVTAGTTYYIAAGSAYAGSRGNFTMTWRMILNDDFANAQVITGNSGSVSGNNDGASAEVGEPVHVNTTGTLTSIWYRWVPTQSGFAVFDTVGSNSDTVLAAYTGSSVSTLTQLTSDDRTNSATSSPGRSLMVFPVTAGTTYSIALGSGYTPGTSNVVLNWRISQIPVLLRQPTIFSTQGTPQSSSTSIAVPVGASVTFLNLTFTGGTVQWQRNGTALAGATAPPLVLSSVQLGDAGIYTAVITNSSGSVTTNPINLVVLTPPQNDSFASAVPLAGLSGQITGTNVNASGETNEPVHWNLPGTASSVWYKWNAPTSGLAAIDTVGSSFDTVMAVYTGTSLTNLTRLTQDDDRGGGRTSLVNFAAISGTTYYIAIGGSYSGARGNIALNWQLTPTLAITVPPANQTVAAGGSATFSLTTTGSGVTYQWNRNGTPIPGATNSTLTIANIQGGADASYTVTITNSSGSLTSEPAALTVAAPALTNLTLRNIRVGGGMLWGVAAGGSTIVAVGDGGSIISSTDNGATWVPRVSGTANWLVGVAYGAGKFVAVGDRGLILVSSDGIAWTPAASTGTTQRVNNVLFADDKFVAVGEGGTILTSTDANIWTPRVSGVTTWLHGLAYNPSVKTFAASGQGGVFLYSSDGVTWNTLPISGLTTDLEATVPVDSYAHFVSIGANGVEVSVRQSQFVLKNGDTLTTWSGATNPTGSSVRFRGLAQGASALFATGEGGKVVTATSDAGPWFTLPSGTTANLLAGIYHNNSLFIVGENETVIQSDPLFSSRLINISTRGQVGTGSNVMISGFVVTGNQPKQVLVRAVGPTLASTFNLAGTLSAPVLTLVDSQNRNVATNTGWLTSTNSGAISSMAARVGAFPFAANSADSAILTTLNPGAYTALVSGVNNGTGIGLVEVYDADTLSNEGSRAINISTRGVAGSGANKIIAGFVIDGASSRRVLIRAVGPGIAAAPFNVSGTLAEPQIELYNGRGFQQATAGAWGLQPNADEIRAAAKAVSAFDLPEGSKDSAMVVTLLPGAWTVQVGGTGDTTGVVLVEVYALP